MVSGRRNVNASTVRLFLPAPLTFSIALNTSGPDTPKFKETKMVRSHPSDATASVIRITGIITRIFRAEEVAISLKKDAEISLQIFPSALLIIILLTQGMKAITVIAVNV
jgi:hypothetical protein